MFRLIYRLLTSPFVKFLFKFIASLTSAIAVISGYLFFVNMNTKSRDEELNESKNELDEEEEDDDDVIEYPSDGFF